MPNVPILFTSFLIPQASYVFVWGIAMQGRKVVCVFVRYARSESPSLLGIHDPEDLRWLDNIIESAVKFAPTLCIRNPPLILLLLL